MEKLLITENQELFGIFIVFNEGSSDKCYNSGETKLLMEALSLKAAFYLVCGADCFIIPFATAKTYYFRLNSLMYCF